MLALSAEDEAVLSLPLPDGIFGFHAQQSCEKLLKALLSANYILSPKTHQLKYLMEGVSERDGALPSMPYDLLRLQPFAVQLRYDYGPGLSDAAKTAIRQSIAILRSHVLARIEALEAGASR